MIKKSLHTITAFALFINQVSIVYAMDPPDKSFNAPNAFRIPLPLSSSEKSPQNQAAVLPQVFMDLDDESLGNTVQINQTSELIVHQRRVSDNPCLYASTNPRFYYELGCAYYSGKGMPQDLEKARQCYEKAIEAGDTKSYYDLADMYEYETGIPQNYEKALIYYIEAAKDENNWLRGEIQYKIAYFYDRGLGTQKNPQKAQEHYKKTHEIALKQLEAGNPLAYNILGLLYLLGRIKSTQNLKNAFLCFEKAFMAKTSEAPAFLGRCYKEGWGTNPLLPIAHLFIDRTAKKNIPLGLYNLALLYRDGEEVKRDDQMALKLFEKAARHYYPDAFYSLGWMYEQGRGTSKNLEKANYYYREGIKRHAEDALYSIGRVYEYGLGGEPIDLLKAQEWYGRAADLGYEMAFAKRVLK